MEINGGFNKFNAHVVSCKELIEQRGCDKAVMNKRLSLKDDGAEKNYFYKKWLSAFKLSFSEKFPFNPGDFFDDNFKAEWCECGYAFDTAKLKALKKCERFVRTMEGRKLTFLEYDKVVEMDLGSNMEWRGLGFHTIRDKVDFVARDEEDGKIHLIKVVNKMSYSVKARKATNKVFNSLELILMKSAFIEEHPDCVCELWAITNSKDKGVVINDEMDVVSHAFEGFESKDALKLLMLDVLALEGDTTKCADCFYSAYCKKGCYRKETTSDEVAKTAVNIAFSPAQKELIDHLDGPMSVLAIPGAGKTASLVERCRVMVQEKNVNPRNILLVAFTKKAVEELKERLKRTLSDNIPKVMTLNAFGNELLLNNSALIGRRLKLATVTDCKALIKELIDKAPQIANMSYEGLKSEYGLVSTLYKWFMEIEETSKEAFAESKKDKDVDSIFTFYDLYMAEYKKRAYLSHDEQITLSLELLKNNPKVALMMSKMYRYIMVDEYQDVNEAQAELVDAIACHHGNLVVVGDDDQSIYGWRGGSNEYLINFPDRYPQARVVVFNDNYRSTDKILSACQQLIKKNDGNRLEKIFISHREGANKPCLFKNFTAENLPAVIGMANKAGFCNGDIAVIVRKNKQIETITKVLEKNNIQSSSPRDALIADVVWQSIRDTLSLAIEGIADIPLYRILRNMGASPYSCIRMYEYKEKSLYDQLVGEQYMFPLMSEAWDNYDIKETANEFEALRYSVSNAAFKVASAFKVLASRKVSLVVPSLAKLLFGEGAESHPAVIELLNQAEERGIADTHKLLEFMNNSAYFDSTDGVDYPVSDASVNLLTAHSSKGKEFPFVIVFGLEEFDEDAESTRLLFVAMSRAKKSLFLTEGPAGHSSLLPYIKDNIMVRA